MAHIPFYKKAQIKSIYQIKTNGSWIATVKPISGQIPDIWYIPTYQIFTYLLSFFRVIEAETTSMPILVMGLGLGAIRNFSLRQRQTRCTKSIIYTHYLINRFDS